MKKLLRNDREIKSVLKSGHTKPPIRKDPFETDIKIKHRLLEMSDEIDSLARKRNAIASEACRLIENKIRTLLYRINARNRIAAEKNHSKRWAIAEDAKAHCYEYGQILVRLIGRWNDGTDFDEDLSYENLDEELLDHISSEYGIRVSFDPGCFGK